MATTSPTTTIDNAALALAAAWWACELAGNTTFDAGEMDPIRRRVTEMLTSVRPAIPGDRLAVFQDRLYELLQYRASHTGLPVILRVDYAAEGLLAEALRLTDLPVDNPSQHLPWKSTMWIRATHVEVRKGRGGIAQVIWGTKPAEPPDGDAP